VFVSQLHLAFAATLCLSFHAMPLAAQIVEPVTPLRALSKVRPPEPPNLDEFVRDRAAAIALGKAFFWDMQIGSDGIQACASCHFLAGADPRARNQISPAIRRVDANWQPSPDFTFDPGRGPNTVLRREDFPLRKLKDADNRSSAVLADTNNVVSSQGVHRTRFAGQSGGGSDAVVVEPDSVFHVGGVNVRQVAPRATPSVINAVFNQRQFWDGRAQSVFNGVNPWGDRDPNARVVMARTPGSLELTRVRLLQSSLASQAVGPPLSSGEYSAQGRTFADIGSRFTAGAKNVPTVAKILKLYRPLARQLVSPDDSVLGSFSAFPLRGLNGNAPSYMALIQSAFQERWWRSNHRIFVAPDGAVSFLPSNKNEDEEEAASVYTLIDYNFSLFFGIAVQMYEASLISDDTPFDRFMQGETGALTEQQKRGLAVFNSDIGRCVNCHGGAEFTNAGVSATESRPVFRRSGNLLDTGFNNIGVRPTREDLGLGAEDPWGVPLAFARQLKQKLVPVPAMTPPYSEATDGLVAVDGAFKTPGLRNVELTAPYFHNGSQLTLRQVIDFYSRGGDFQPIDGRDGNIAPLRTIALSESDKEAVVAFLRALTDERVRYERAPFDHPEILVPEGHPVSNTWVLDNGKGAAIDILQHVPAVGRQGRLVPPRPFLE
jgi:cytochrome c peroxidase